MHYSATIIAINMVIVRFNMEQKDNYNYIVEKIERIRKEKKKLSRYRLAQRSELSQSSLTNLLNRGNTPSIQTIEKICNGLDISLAEFFSAGNERRDLTKEQTRILDAWDKLDTIEKARVEGYIEGILSTKE